MDTRVLAVCRSIVSTLNQGPDKHVEACVDRLQDRGSTPLASTFLIFSPPPAVLKDHRLIDERSLAFDRLVAEKIASDPGVLDHARANLERWLLTCSPRLRPTLLEWQELLNAQPERLRDTLLSTDEHAIQLRQSSPFAGVLTPSDRARILREFQLRESSPA